MRVLVGGVGYPDLSDQSFGPELIERLAERAWPEGVSVQDVSFNPIAVVQQLEATPPGEQPDRLVFVAGVSRPGREPGTVEGYRWDRALPSAELIQGAVAEAVTGVISLDNTVVICEHFGALPAEVAIVEVEPRDETFDAPLSDCVAAQLEPVAELVTLLATERASISRLPSAPLGAGRRLPTDRVGA